MTCKANVVVCSEIRTKHLSQSEHHLEFLMLNLVVRIETAKLWKVKVIFACFFCLLYKSNTKGKAVPLQAWTGPEGSWRLRFPDFKTIGTWRW
jgi:hypothetical protein